jgi:hypothetical protein
MGYKMRRHDKKIKLNTTENRSFTIDLDEVACDRATYYSERDTDTSWQEEYDYTYDDPFEPFDWLMNNMNWDECKTLKEVPRSSSKLRDLEVEEKYIIDNEGQWLA